MSLEHIRFEKKDRVAMVTLDRPDVLNSLNAKLIGELGEVLDDVSADSAVGALILTGAGDKAFVAGADIAELAKLDPVRGRETSVRGQRVLRRLETLGKPSIAAVNGFALGGGCELAMACTMRIASDRARFGQPEVNLGIIPGYAGTQRLARLVGKGVAMDLILTGRLIDAQEALRIGLVTRVVAHGELLDAARSTAETLLQKGPLALEAAMDVVDRGYDMNFDDACMLEAAAFGVLCASEDKKEGLEAFLGKRKPEFEGK